ncbi:MAG TPA: acyl-CoA dehydrogenase family protein [Acidimicrobiia bacterium]|nr:acyl-CoA dehydrogenase family protein [Acidimicrobiia bacterium]
MHFAFTDEQIALRDATRDLLTKECSPAHVRDAWTNETGRVPGLWEQLDSMGVIGLLAPEAAGGLGLSFVDLVLVLEETGRHAVPEPIVETAAYGVPLLGRADVTIAAGESYVPWADSADVVYTAAGRFERDDVTLVARPSVDGARRLFEVQGNAEAVEPAAGLAAYDRGVCGIAAQQCGLADRMLELTADYVRERRQFGVPVGSFQAVKHHLADARIALEFARPLVYRAAASIAADDAGTSTHVSMAKAKADAAALQTARAALQCHGAIGYTTEYDLHLYLKRSWALARSWGDAAFHRDRVSRAIL